MKTEWRIVLFITTPGKQNCGVGQRQPLYWSKWP